MSTRRPSPPESVAGAHVARSSVLLTPAVAVAAIALATLGVVGVLAWLVPVPRFFMDELTYTEAAVSLARGDGLSFRGEGWGYGPLFPVLLAGLVRLTASQETTYDLVKLANSVCFALAVAPVYLLARRVLRPWSSVVATGLAALIPSTMYASVVMTESVAYLVAMLSLLVGALALERITPLRQLGAVALLVCAVAVRTQFVALLLAYVLALVLVVVLVPGQRAALRARPASLLPLTLVLVAGAARVAWSAVAGPGVDGALGSYAVLARSYAPLDLGLSFLRQAGDLTLYLGVVPVVVAPVVVAMWARRARAGDLRYAAVAALFVSVNIVMLAVVAAFASTEFALGLLHDRNLFYLVPLWLIVLLAWIDERMPRPPALLALGAGIAVVAIAALPYGQLGESNWAAQFEATATELWAVVAEVVGRLPVVTLPIAMLGFAGAVVVAVAVVPRRAGWALVGLVGLTLLANAIGSWRSAFPEEAANAAGARGARSWVDERVTTHGNAALLFVVRDCERPLERNAGLQTLFFNRSVETSLAVGFEGVGQPAQADVRGDRRILRSDGRPIVARFVVTQPGVELVGRPIARGSRAGLVLWAVDPPLRAASARSNRELAACG